MNKNIMIIAMLLSNSLSTEVHGMMKMLKSSLKKHTEKTAVQATDKPIDTEATPPKAKVGFLRETIHTVRRYRHPQHYDRDNTSDEESDDELKPPLVYSNDDDHSSGSDSDSDNDHADSKSEFIEYVELVVKAIKDLEASDKYTKLPPTEIDRALFNDLKLSDNSYFKGFLESFQIRFQWATLLAITKWRAQQDDIKQGKKVAQMDLKKALLSYL